MDEEHIDLIRLGFANALVIGHKPEKLSLDQVAKKIELEKFDVANNGFWDSAAPNYHTFYPEVKPEDLKPEADTFIRPTYRALSKVIVRRRTNPVDFSKGTVLKDSMPLLMRHTVHVDHETSIGNAVGSIASVAFQEKYNANGVTVPAGINAELLIDGKSHPNIARKIMMEPPAIHSASVTVRFGWEPSHKFEDVREFLHKIGQFGEDGQLIRRIVTEIKAYNEISLVGHGADPFAQLLDEDGKIVNPKMAEANESLSAQGKEKPQHYFFDYKTDTVSNSADYDDTSDSNNTNDKLNIKMKEFLLLLAAKLTIQNFESLNEQALQRAVEEATDAYVLKAEKNVTDELTAVTRERDDEKTAHDALKELTKDLDLDKLKDLDIRVLEANSQIGDVALKSQRETCEKTYKKLKGENTDEAMLTTIKEANFASLVSLTKTFKEQLDDKYPGKCNDCKSTNVSRNAAVTEKGVTDPAEEQTEEEKNEKEDEGNTEELSNQEVMDKMRKPDISKSSAAMHGIKPKKEDS